MSKFKVGMLKWTEVYENIYSNFENEDINICIFCGCLVSDDIICPMCIDNLY
ncbi:hypothetical protein [Crassaminicella thermophila]|uniref:hypothetical protein n=1 Tax=Crassaminicella thermophila TaxID=2599308 RepID=UPI00143D1C63|nr:hypothetical protein [Crassaminicella thermophila]